MPNLCIRLKGAVSFQKAKENSVGYFYDICTDSLGIPFLPVAEILGDKKFPVAVEMGVAHPDGYLGILKRAYAFSKVTANSQKYISAFFAEDFFDSEHEKRIRALKANQTFVAKIDFDTAEEQKVTDFLKSIDHIGITSENITGEVECYLLGDTLKEGTPPKISKLCNYTALDYSLMLLTPTCFYAPYATGIKTFNFVPGTVIKNKFFPKTDEKIICTNAYISEGDKRLLPAPLCMAVVKLEKEQLRHRLSTNKITEKIEQDVTLSNVYCENYDEHFMRYVQPETEHIFLNGEIYDALSLGQVFSGTIYAPDEILRQFANSIAENPIVNIGDFHENGFGEIYIKTVRLREKEIPKEIFAKCFDVVCLSDTIILNSEGMPGTKAEDLLTEIEQIPGFANKLLIEGRYTDISNEFSENRTVLRCLKAGSVMRLKTKDDAPINIAPLLHIFIGERNSEGYGEIMAYPAQNSYYRIAEKIPPSKFSLEYPLTCRELSIGSKIISDTARILLKQKVEYLALLDLQDNKVNESPPQEILSILKYRYAPIISDSQVVEWYLNRLEATK